MAYVGTEIQDIVGIDVPSFRRASFLADAFFQKLTARQAMGLLRRLSPYLTITIIPFLWQPEETYP